MAKTIARAWGYDATRVKETHRLGSQQAAVEAATWYTFARAQVRADGSGTVQVTRDGVLLHRFDFGPEFGPDGVSLDTAVKPDGVVNP